MLKISQLEKEQALPFNRQPPTIMKNTIKIHMNLDQNDGKVNAMVIILLLLVDLAEDQGHA